MLNLIAKLIMFTKHSSNLLENLKLHKDDNKWFNRNKGQLKAELKGIKIELTQIINLLDEDNK